MQVAVIAIITLSMLVLILVYMLALAVNRISWLHEDLQASTDAEHSRCMAAVMKFIGDEWAAQILEVAAADYANAENHAELDRIGRLVYKPGGLPVPSLWMQERADRLRIFAAENSTVEPDRNEVIL